jgi:hypothetical protein
MKNFSNDVFNSVLSFFEESKDISNESNILGLIYLSIEDLINCQKNHTRGMEWYIKNKFLFLQDVLPKTATEEDFKNLFFLCSVSKKLFKNQTYGEFLDKEAFDFKKDATIRETQELEMCIYCTD